MKKLKLLFILSLILLTGCGSNQDQQTIADLQSTVDSLTQKTSDLQSQVNQYSGVKSDLETANNSIKELEAQLESLKAENESMSLKLEMLYTIEPLDKIMYAVSEADTYSDLFGEVLGYEKIGGLSVNQEVHVIGQSKSTGWYEIEVSGSEKQFVSNQFLSTTKITLTQTTPTTTTTSTQSTQSQTTNPTNPNQGISAEDQAILDALGFTYESGEGWDTPSPIAGDYSGLEGIHAE